jgi:hypothetical protein
VNAHSRVQIALAEAKAKARAEFDSVLEQRGKSLDDLIWWLSKYRASNVDTMLLSTA